MNHKSMSVTVIMFILSLLVFSASSFAWFALSDSSRVNEFVVPVNNYEAEIIFQVSKNGGTYTTITTEAEMTAFLNNAMPGDLFDFIVTIENLSTSSVVASIYFNDVTSDNPNAGYDMRNVFYIVDGGISVNASTLNLPLNSTTPLTFEGQTFSNYRLNNLIDASQDITIVTNVNIPISQIVFIEFSIQFDPNTSNQAYQAGIMRIASLLAVFDA
jgi:hypothetical protein